MKALEVENLRKTYRYGAALVEAVRSVSLTLTAGEVLAFLGPNGAGKTTTIKMIAGLIRPDAGRVRIAGLDPHRNPQALRLLGAVLEGNRNLYWRLTPEENLEYFGVLKGLSCREARWRGRVLLERFELTSKRRTTVQTLSRGMQQKLALAVALVQQPKLLLLDEPTLGLDVEATQNVKALVKAIASEGCAILLTTHQLDIAEELSDRVAIILSILLLIMPLTGSRLAFPLTLLLPLLTVLLGAYGLAFMMGSLALLLKRVQQLLGIFQFALLFLMTTPTETWAGSLQLVRWVLPMTAGAGLLRDLMARGKALDFGQFSLALLNGIGYLTIGILIFRFAERETKRRGKLSGY